MIVCSNMNAASVVATIINGEDTKTLAVKIFQNLCTFRSLGFALTLALVPTVSITSHPVKLFLSNVLIRLLYECLDYYMNVLFIM